MPPYKPTDVGTLKSFALFWANVAEQIKIITNAKKAVFLILLLSLCKKNYAVFYIIAKLRKLFRPDGE
jgi:hypothetical protein